MNPIEVRSTDRKGRGLFARAAIAADALLEEAPVKVLPDGALLETPLEHYRFDWDAEHEAVAFGALSFANHSAEPNGWLELDTDARVMRLYALREIPADEEITVDYDCELWFDPAA